MCRVIGACSGVLLAHDLIMTAALGDLNVSRIGPICSAFCFVDPLVDFTLDVEDSH